MNPKLWEHLRVTSPRVAGVFYPHAYAIGVANFEDIKRYQAYPLPEDDPDETSIFFNNLVLYHETVHLSQYISTSFGLEMARLTNICQNILLHKGPWEPPILIGRKDIEIGTLMRFLSYLYVADSMRIHTGIFPPGSLDVPSKVSLVSRPASPALSFLGKRRPSLFEPVETIKGCNWSVHSQPHLLITRNDGGTDEIVLNAGALFEGFAHLAEINHISNAFSLGYQEILESFLLQYPPIYIAAFVAYIHIFELPFEKFTTHLAALIDIALMHSPQLIHNVLPSEKEYKLPAETFFDACRAAREVTPLRDHSYEEAQRYQDDVCAKMNIPKTSEMAERCLQHLTKMGIDNKETYKQWIEDRTPINSKRMFALHWLGMSLRKKHSPGFYIKMIKTDLIIEMFERSLEGVTQFDLYQKQPINPHRLPLQLSQLCMHSLIHDAFYKKRLNCPLKAGNPVYCPLADADENKLCKYVVQDGSEQVLGECPLDIFEHLMAIRSSDNPAG